MCVCGFVLGVDIGFVLVIVLVRVRGLVRLRDRANVLVRVFVLVRVHVLIVALALLRADVIAPCVRLCAFWCVLL